MLIDQLNVVLTQGALQDNAHYRRRLREVFAQAPDGPYQSGKAVGIFAGAAFRSLDRLYDPGTWAACSLLRRGD